MNKKLLTLAVAAALAAPTMASAEAILYGKLHVSLDYESINNVIPSVYNNTSTTSYTAYGAAGPIVIPATAGSDIFVAPDGTFNPLLSVPTGTVLTPAQAEAVRGLVRLAPGQRLNGQDFSGWGVSRGANFQGEGRASRFGLKGSEDLGNGLKAVYQIEIGVNFDTNNNLAGTTYTPDAIYYRNTFAGLAGDWGTALIGRHDSPLKISTARLDLFTDTMADYNGTIGFDDVRLDNAVAYISPSWSGFQLAVALAPGGGATVLPLAAGSTAGTYNINSDQINSGYSLAGIYKNGPFYGSLAYESFSEELNMSTAQSVNVQTCLPTVTTLAGGFGTVTQATCNRTKNAYNKWRIGLGLLDWNGFSLTGIYEQQDNLFGSDSYTSAVYSDPRLAGLSYNLPGRADKRELWQIQAGYAFGRFMFKGMYGQTTFSGSPSVPSLTNFGQTTGNAAVYRNILNNNFSGSTSSWAIGADYNFSKRTTAYVLYTATSSDQGNNPTLANTNLNGVTLVSANGVREWDGFSLGFMHSF